MARSLTDYAAYLFDIDGTLLRPGSTIPGAVEALTALKAHGKSVRAVTNNSRMAHHAVAERFRRYGLPLEDDEVFSALRATQGDGLPVRRGRSGLRAPAGRPLDHGPGARGLRRGGLLPRDQP
jgi:Haloacid dehalogenase-like hydrolase